MTALAASAGWVGAVWAGFGRGESALALLGAWVLQMAAFMPLARRLREGRDATRIWIAGIAARLGGLLAVWSAARLGLVSDRAPVLFGLGLTMLIILEGVWLAVASAKPRSDDERWK